MSIWEQIQLNLIEKDRYIALLDGLRVTLVISFFAVIMGVAIGLLLAFMNLSNFKLYKYRPLRWLSSVYVDIIRGTPVVTQLLIFYFVIFKSASPIFAAVIAFGANSGAYVSEIIRAGILSVDKGQVEAGLSLGFTHAKTMRLIIIPQAIKNIFPALCNEFVVLIKETAAVGYISVTDLTKAGQIIYSRTLNAFVPLLSAAALYFVVVKILTIIFRGLENKLRESDAK